MNVMKEILNVPDNIPQSLSDKADRVVVFVMKSTVPAPACANQTLGDANAGSPKISLDRSRYTKTDCTQNE
jgi:hypothetical protein